MKKVVYLLVVLAALYSTAVAQPTPEPSGTPEPSITPTLTPEPTTTPEPIIFPDPKPSLEEVKEDGKLPNILLIITDDQRFDDLDEFMPETTSRIFDEGVRYNKAYITTPSCCPSRASIFTGLYSQNNGVNTNRHKLRKATVMEVLHEEKGYFTGIIGKYLNSWPGEARPEFDFWASWGGGWKKAGLVLRPTPFRTDSLNISGELVPRMLVDKGYVPQPRNRDRRRTHFWNPIMNIQGTWIEESGYVTDVFDRHAETYFAEAFSQDNPFMLVLSYNAPHYPALPHPDHAEVELAKTKTRPPSYDKAIANLPRRRRSLRKKLDGQTIKFLDTLRSNQRRSLMSVDRSIGRVLDKIEDEDELDNTLIIFLSDNGYLFGEHMMTSKGKVYEESIKVPFGVRYPKGFKESEVSDKLISNVDIAPTIYELTDTEPPYLLDGTSLIGDDAQDKKRYLLLEGPKKNYRAIHDGRYVLVANKRSGGKDKIERLGWKIEEFYDLERDPYQMRNVLREQRYSSIIRRLRSELSNSRSKRKK